LGKGGSNNIERQVFKTFLILGSNGIAAIHIEATLEPIHHVLDHNIIDFSFGFEHFYLVGQS
jgi:hypothetical protein